MAQPVQNVFQALDQALAAAVAAAGRSVVQVSRGHGHAGTGIVWADDLVISSSFHSPDRTKVGIPAPRGNGDPADEEPRTLDHREAEVIGRDPGTDIALLRVTGGGLTAATFRDLGGLAVGNLALALGRPGRTVRASLRAVGVLGPAVRTPHGGKLDRYVESDRQIPRGFAGGPLIDADGAVIGMNTRSLLRGADIAVPTATLRRVVAELAAHGGVRRGYLGSARTRRSCRRRSPSSPAAIAARWSPASRTAPPRRPPAWWSATSSSSSPAHRSPTPTACGSPSATGRARPSS